MRWFTSDKRVLEMPDVVQICMRGKNEHLKVYIQALWIPLLCSHLQDQAFNRVFSDDNSYLKDLVSSDNYKDTN